MSRPFAFLDRDGTLIRDRGYTHRIEDYARLEGAVQAVRALRADRLGIAIVTNQSGIGRGLFSAAQCDRFHEHLRADFAAAGAPIDAILLCPHHPDERCACRKPETGLLDRARRELGAALASSWVIGNRPSDVEAAQRAGCRAVYVLTGDGHRHREAVAPDVPVTADVLEAARHVVEARRRERSRRPGTESRPGPGG